MEVFPKNSPHAVGQSKVPASTGSTKNHRCPLPVKGTGSVSGIRNCPLNRLKCEKLGRLNTCHRLWRDTKFHGIKREIIKKSTFGSIYLVLCTGIRIKICLNIPAIFWYIFYKAKFCQYIVPQEIQILRSWHNG